MKIVILEADTLGTDMDLSGFRKFGEVVIYNKTTEEECPERVKNADIILVNKLQMCCRTLYTAENLKLICVTATGINNIDLDYAQRHGIAVTNVAGYSSESVAQHTFAMFFYLAEKLNYYDDYVKSGAYAKSSMFTNLEYPFFELKGKTWGIVGLGNIGRRVAQIAACFGCKVVYYSTSGNHQDPDYERVDFQTLLKNSDIISIHAPLNDATQNLFALESFVNMKRSAFLINVGRGKIVNETDLVIALNEGLIAGAALDVMETEPILAGNPLFNVRDMNKLHLTPHIAWASVESRSKLIRLVINNIEAYLAGEAVNRIC